MDFKYVNKVNDNDDEAKNKKGNIKKRDFSIIEFQLRLKDLVLVDKTPDMEKLNFVKIISSNLQEFISVRLPNVKDENDRENVIHIIESIFDDIGKETISILKKHNIDPKFDKGIIKNIAHRNIRYIYSGESQIEVVRELTRALLIKDRIKSSSVLCEDSTILKPFRKNQQVIKVPVCVIMIDKVIELVKPFASKSDYYNNPPIIYDRLYYRKELISRDILIRNPYEDYQMVLDFIDQMCTNKKTKAVFITLYRTAESSVIVKSLVKAARAGKEVFVFIEPTARDNEKNNLENIEILKKYKTCVRFNYMNYKVHGKMFLAVDKKGKRFAHIATGNFNEKTAKFYTDSHLITANKYITLDVLNIMMSLFRKKVYKPLVSKNDLHLFASPVNFRSNVIRLLDDEIEKGKDGRIWIKCNSLCDKQIIDKLYYAAEKEVDVRVITRTGCSICFNPNLPVRSKVGQYLEHDRIYVFGDRCFISSADLLLRNMSKRLEILCEIVDNGNKDKVIDTFNFIWDSDIHELSSNGKWYLKLT